MVQDWEHRREEDRLLIERLLIIIRNILHVPPNVTQEMVRFLLFLVQDAVVTFLMICLINPQHSTLLL